MEGAFLAVAAIVLCVGTAIGLWILRTQSHSAPAAPTSNFRDLQALDLSDPSGECDFHIVGESNYQPELRRVARSGRTFLAVLIPEPSNPKDPNAIRVVAEGGRTIGYLDRDYARQYQEAFSLLKDAETILADIRDTRAGLANFIFRAAVLISSGWRVATGGRHFLGAPGYNPRTTCRWLLAPASARMKSPP